MGGRTSTTMCKRHWDDSCTNPASEQIFKDQCDKRNSCVITADYLVYGDPCPSKPKYSQVDYTCVKFGNGCSKLGEAPDKNAGDKCKQITCPDITTDGDFTPTTATVFCTSGRNWGEKCTVNCNPGYDLVGIEASKVTSVQITCAGEQITPTGSWDSIPKCIKTASHEFIACGKGGEQTLSCPNGQTISIVRAYYGRLSKTICGNHDVDWCVQDDSEQIIRDLCDNKQSCAINPDGTDITDPCPKKQKYAKVDYDCV